MSLLARWEPFLEMQENMRRMQREMDRLFGRWAPAFERRPELAVSYPAVNLWEDDDFVYAEAELPGIRMENLEITVSAADQLTIKGERKPPAPGKAEWHRQERGFGTFERCMDLPTRVDAGKVEARLENGVLSVKMAKSPEARPRKIPVKAE